VFDPADLVPPILPSRVVEPMTVDELLTAAGMEPGTWQIAVYGTRSYFGHVSVAWEGPSDDGRSTRWHGGYEPDDMHAVEQRDGIWHLTHRVSTADDLVHPYRLKFESPAGAKEITAPAPIDELPVDAAAARAWLAAEQAARREKADRPYREALDAYRAALPDLALRTVAEDAFYFLPGDDAHYLLHRFGVVPFGDIQLRYSGPRRSDGIVRLWGEAMARAARYVAGRCLVNWGDPYDITRDVLSEPGVSRWHAVITPQGGHIGVDWWSDRYRSIGWRTEVGGDDIALEMVLRQAQDRVECRVAYRPETVTDRQRERAAVWAADKRQDFARYGAPPAWGAFDFDGLAGVTPETRVEQERQMVRTRTIVAAALGLTPAPAPADGTSDGPASADESDIPDQDEPSEVTSEDLSRLLDHFGRR
jgi:hypothetical protein